MSDSNNKHDEQPFNPESEFEGQQQYYGYEQMSDQEMPPAMNPIRMTFDEARSLRTIQRMAMASGICGLVSMFIGGVALSTAGLIVALLGMGKLKSHSTNDGRIVEFLGKLKRLLVSSIVVCVIGLCLNAYAAFTIFPDVLEAVQTSDYSQLFGHDNGTDKNESNSSSIWG